MKDRSGDHAASRRGGTLRRAMAVLLGAIAAVVLAAALAIVLLQHSTDARAAISLLHTARPWLITAQIAILGLAWHRWPRIVAAFARWRSLSPAQHDALLRGRNRIFVLLAACELLIVLRAFAG